MHKLEEDNQTRFEGWDRRNKDTISDVYDKVRISSQDAIGENTAVTKKVNALEDLMTIQRSELFRAMSDFEAVVSRKHDNFHKAFRILSSELKVPNPLLSSGLM